MKTEETVKRLTLIGGALEITAGSEHYSVLVEFHRLNNREDEFYNATAIVKQYNENKGGTHPDKLLSNFTKSARFKELIKISLFKLNSEERDLVYKKRVGSRVQTFIHKDLFLSLMIWLDARYELEITDLIKQVSLQHYEVADTRAITKQIRKSFTETIEKLCAYAVRSRGRSYTSGRCPMYMTYSRMIFKELGLSKLPKGVNRRDHYTADEITDTERIEANISGLVWDLIDEDMEYHEIYKAAKREAKEWVREKHATGDR